MSSLYDMTIRRKTIIGNADGTVSVAYKHEAMTAMPGTFVNGFRRDFPDAVVTVAERYPEASAGRRAHAGGNGTRRPHAAPTPATASTAAACQAAPSHQLGDLINEELAK